MRIVILTLDNINNVGDELLGKTTEFIAKNACNNIDIIRCQFMPSFSDLKKKYPYTILSAPIKYLAIHLRKYETLAFYLWKICYYIKYKAYYDDLLSNADKIIVAIGMLKFESQNFSYIYYMINKIAEKKNVQIMMSAMSIAKVNFKDRRCKQLVEAVNMNSVKIITTRDGVWGINRLKEHYLHEGKTCDYVGDPALWTVDMYNIKRNENSNVIGINLIRPSIYESYKEENFSSDEVVALYKGIIIELEKRGYDWQLYDNGMGEDHKFGEFLIKTLNLPSTKLSPRPKDSEEYVKMIANFKAVFGARLHACITAVSLGIPVAGLLWDNKLEFFSETMGIRHLFINASELNGKKVVDKIETAIIQNMNNELILEYKNRTLESIIRFLHIPCKG